MPLFGDNPQYVTMEVSGLPPASAGTFARLKSARDAFQKLLRRQDARDIRFYDPPIPIRVEGSLFFDISRAHGQALNRRGCIHICPHLRGPPDFRHRIRTRADGAIGQHKRPPHRTCHPVAAAGFFRIEPEARPDSGNEFKGTDVRSGDTMPV